MPDAADQRLLEALLDSWDRNNTILTNLLRAIPDEGLDARAMDSSPTAGEMFGHIHFVRLIFVVVTTAFTISSLITGASNASADARG